MAEQISQTKEALALRGLTDPVFFCAFFLSHLFGGTEPGDNQGGPIPWFHRGILAILLRQTAFLWNYGEVSKIMREFIITRPDVLEEDRKTERPLGFIFRVYGRTDGQELTWQEVAELEKRFTPTELNEALEIALHIKRFTLIMVPRGYSKTTIAGIAVPIFKIVYKLSNLFAYISESGDHAEMQAINIRSELEENHALIQVFGNLVPGKGDSQKWTERFFESTNGVALAARGRGAQIRGLNHRGHRPDAQIWDDLESKESVKTEHQRKKTKVWAYGDAIPALPQLDKSATITALGTLLAQICLMMELATDDEWTCIRFSVVDKEGLALWPLMMDLKEIEQKKRAYERKGLLYLFYLEYYNVFVPDAVTKFVYTNFIFENIPHEEIVAWGMYADPAIGKKQTNDYAVIMVGGMTKTGRVFVAAEWRARGLPNMIEAFIEAYFKLAMLFRPHHAGHGFESNGFQKAIGSLLTHEMARKEYYFEPIGTINTNSKSERIMGDFHPRYSAGFIVFATNFTNSASIAETCDYDPALTDQEDDGPDCISGLIKMLEPFNPYASPSDSESEEDDLAEFPPIEDTWRISP